MTENLLPIDAFRREMNVEFAVHFTRSLPRLYRETYLEVEDFPKSYQRYLRPHILRARVELALLTTAKAHNLQASTSRNSSKDAHALVMDGRYVITVSRSKSPNAPPRPARFRTTYAAYCDLGQLPLPGSYFSHDRRKVIPISDRAHPRYVLITHGSKDNDWRELGFVYANIVVPSGRSFRFLGSGIDLLARFGYQDAADIEQVPEPQVGLQSVDKRAGIEQ